MPGQAAYNSEIRLAFGPGVSFTDEAMTSSDRTIFAITDQSKRLLDDATPVVVQVAHDEIQTVSLTGGPTGGSFTLTFSTDETDPIPFNATASVVQGALEDLPSIGAGNVLVTGSAGGPWTIRFTASLGKADQAQLTKDETGLTGGISPNVSVVTTQAGSGFTTVSVGFTLRLVGAIVTFPSQQALGTFVRLHSGKYLPSASIGKADTGEFNGQLDVKETTYFDPNGTGAQTFTPTILSGEFKAHVWWESSGLLTHLKARDRLVLSFNLSNLEKYEGYCYVSDTSIKSDVMGVVEEDTTFKLTNTFFMGV